MLKTRSKKRPETQRRSFLENSQATVNDPFVQTRLKAVFSGQKYFDAPDGRRYELTPLGIFDLLSPDALCYLYLEREEEAKQIFLKAFEGGKKHMEENLNPRRVDTEHPPTFAEHLFQMALYASLASDEKSSHEFFSEAEKYHQRAIEYWTKLFYDRKIEGKIDDDVGYHRLNRSYCLTRLDAFKEALGEAEAAKLAAASAPHKSNLDLPPYKYLPPVLTALCNHKLRPNETTLKEARDAIRRYKEKLETEGFETTGYMLIYDLQQSFPDVYEPVLP